MNMARKWRPKSVKWRLKDIKKDVEKTSKRREFYTPIAQLSTSNACVHVRECDIIIVINLLVRCMNASNANTPY